MGVLAISFARLDKIITNFFFSILPQVIRFLILFIAAITILYRRVSAHYKYMSMINKNSSKFVYKRESTQDLSRCTICLSEIREGEVARTLQCEHMFHRNCLDRWLRGGGDANCPLCRRAVLPGDVVAEYQLMQKETADGVIEKELALVLLSTLKYGSCHHNLPNYTNYF